VRQCGQTFTLPEFDWTCPNCQGKIIDVISGKELFVEVSRWNNGNQDFEKHPRGKRPDCAKTAN